ncbi:MAG: agmatine deiminase family protein [Rhodospirillales bacterium]|nr:MAG: agmatine deiminase family protein [Rhodospirillales bacterium]
MTVPAAEGFYMPAEWQLHARCWMAWPCREELWGDRIEDARQAYAGVARVIAEFEPITMIANPSDVAAASMACGRGVEILPMDIDDSWMRDVGPTYVVDGRGGIAACDWHFNAWGQKYEYYNNDARLAEALLAQQGIRRFDAPFVMEGGAVHTDGEGTLLTTESVLLNPNRNPGMDREETVQSLRDWLGVDKIIWLPAGCHDDETDGHIDNVACFVRPGVVLAASCPDQSDPNYEICRENIGILRGSADAKGRKLEVITVDQPSRMEDAGTRLSSSYVNLYIANGGVVMPGFEDRRDNAAFKTVAQAFADRKVIQISSTDIVRGGGGIHCITQQQPDAGHAP